MKEIKGIGASNGIAIAKAFKLENITIQVNDTKSEDSEKELEKYLNAATTSLSQINNIKNIAAKNLSAEELEVFDAHMQIVEDPAMKEEISNLINNDKFNAVYAVNAIYSNYIAMFEGIDDEYMRERAADLKDVSLRIQKNILGIASQDLSTINENTIIVAEDLTPSETAQLNKEFVKGFLTNIGGRTSHSAIMARSLEIPAILGLGNITETVQTGDLIVMDGLSGIGYVNPDKSTVNLYEEKYNSFIKEKEDIQKYLNEVSKTQDNKELLIAANIGSVSDVHGVLSNGADAVGLFRSEFLYMDALDWPTEEEQFKSYKTVLESMKDKTVIVRTLDIGGDKTLKYFKFPEESNPFLGYRAIRMTLDKKDIFVTQLRALIRSSVYGKLGIMFPMIATIDEFKAAKAIYEEVKAQLIKEGHKVANDIEVGMMVEVPSSAIHADQFAKYADFLSIGTNDLMQYTMAADRMNEKVSYLYQPLNPSILKMIKMAIDGAHKHNKWIGMCGEMGGDPEAIPLLVGMGLDEFSMSASSVLPARKQIANIDSIKAKELVEKALEMDNEDQVKKLVEEFNSK